MMIKDGLGCDDIQIAHPGVDLLPYYTQAFVNGDISSEYLLCIESILGRRNPIQKKIDETKESACVD